MRFAILFFATGLAFAQLDTNTVTVDASRNVSVVADQVFFGIVLHTDASTTLSDVVARLEGTSITAASLVYLSSRRNPDDDPSLLNWSFELVVPFFKMKDTTTTLARLKDKLGLYNGTPVLNFAPLAQRWSDDVQLSACPLTALVDDARREAEGLASAAGMRLGSIVALSDQTSPTVMGFASSSGTPPGWYGMGDFDDLISHGSATPRRPCLMVVQFRLLP